MWQTNKIVHFNYETVFHISFLFIYENCQKQIKTIIVKVIISNSYVISNSHYYNLNTSGRIYDFTVVIESYKIKNKFVWYVNFFFRKRVLLLKKEK